MLFINEAVFVDFRLSNSEAEAWSNLFFKNLYLRLAVPDLDFSYCFWASILSLINSLNLSFLGNLKPVWSWDNRKRRFSEAVSLTTELAVYDWDI